MKEKELFDWLREAYLPDLIHSPQEYDGFDCTTDKYKMFIELKSRKTHYPDLLIEKMKYDFLLEEAHLLGFTPWYINSTPQGVWAFPLHMMMPIEWNEKWLPSTTEFANKNNKMKLVGFLHLDNGVKIK